MNLYEMVEGSSRVEPISESSLHSRCHLQTTLHRYGGYSHGMAFSVVSVVVLQGSLEVRAPKLSSVGTCYWRSGRGRDLEPLNLVRGNKLAPSDVVPICRVRQIPSLYED